MQNPTRVEDVLIKRIVSGDETAFDELIARFYPAIFQYSTRRTVSKESAEDATQQTFLNFFSNFYQYEHRGKCRAYLYSIARNICINLSAKPKTEPLEENIIYTEYGFDDIELKADIAPLFQLLTPEQKEIVDLRFNHDLTFREIGDIIGLPPRTVQTKMRKILKIFREKVGELGVWQ